jgi:hypothetical protein
MRAHLALLLVLLSACTSGRAATTTTKIDRNLITQQQIAEHKFQTAFEAVEALHSNWLQEKGVDSANQPTKVQVYLDNTRLGGTETLRTVNVVGVTYIRYYDGVAASARWGLDHGQGVIYVSTHP